jgi:hypothetical protein
MLLFMDGFEHYSGDVNNYGKWSTASTANFGTTPSGSPRTGGRALQAYNIDQEGITNTLPVVGKGFVVGLAVRPTATATDPSNFLRIKENAISHLMVTMIAGNMLQVKVGTTVLATGTVALPINSWSYVEFKGEIDSVAGSFEVRIDGVTEPALVGTGVNTQNGGTGAWNQFALTAAVTGWAVYYDDLYVCDQSGSTLNNFLGPIRIETLMAQPGNGSNVGLTPSTGTDHGAMVDEPTSPNTTDYNSSATVGAKDTYNLPTPALVGEVLAIQTNLYVAKTDVGARQVCTVVRTGSPAQDVDGPAKSVLTIFSYLTTPFSQNPVTLQPWTLAEMTALEVGMKVVA